MLGNSDSPHSTNSNPVTHVSVYDIRKPYHSNGYTRHEHILFRRQRVVKITTFLSSHAVVKRVSVLLIIQISIYDLCSTVFHLYQFLIKPVSTGPSKTLPQKHQAQPEGKSARTGQRARVITLTGRT